MTSKNILIIRRDNIGDMICTLPLIQALYAERQCNVSVFTNAYVAPILHYAPSVCEIFHYPKAKHGVSGRWTSAFHIVRSLVLLRRRDFEWIIACGDREAHLARLIVPADRILRVDDVSLDSVEPRQEHEIDRIWRFAPKLGLTSETAPLPILTSSSRNNKQRNHQQRIVGLQISARRPMQRMRLDYLVVLLNALLVDRYTIKVLWAPGNSSNPEHPGDDALANALRVYPSNWSNVMFSPTNTLDKLIEELSECALVITPDGGAAHISAALGVPTLTLFGDSDPSRWAPRGTHTRIIHSSSKQVETIPVSTVRFVAQSMMEEVFSS